MHRLYYVEDTEQILCDLDPKVKVIGQKAGICDGVPSTSALVYRYIHDFLVLFYLHKNFTKTDYLSRSLASTLNLTCPNDVTCSYDVIMRKRQVLNLTLTLRVPRFSLRPKQVALCQINAFQYLATRAILG